MTEEYRYNLRNRKIPYRNYRKVPEGLVEENKQPEPIIGKPDKDEKVHNIITVDGKPYCEFCNKHVVLVSKYMFCGTEPFKVCENI